MVIKSVGMVRKLQSPKHYWQARRIGYRIGILVKRTEATIKQFNPDLFKAKEFVRCPYCGNKLPPGLMNISKHWVECPHSPILKNSLESKTLLIDEIKKNIKF
jgi:hypothetical protein